MPADSLKNYTTGRLGMLCGAAGFGPQRTQEIKETFAALVSPWAERPVQARSQWVSDIADDNTPIEFSMAISDSAVEVRALFETQADQPTLAAYRKAGLEFQERLAREFGASLDRLRQVEDLFVPEGMQGGFAIWNAVVFSQTRPPEFKAYLNPQAQGVDNAAELIRAGLSRLGLSGSWGLLEETVLRRGFELDELKYLALDLIPGQHSRIKVYVRHHEVTPRELEAAASAAETYVPGETQEFVRAMCGENELLLERAAFTCSSFVDGSRSQPKATTVYVPVCAYARDDSVVLERVCQYMQSIGADSSRYESIIRGFANRPLDDGVGMQPWAAFRRHGGVRITSYLASEAYHVHAPGTVPAPTQLASGTRRVAARCSFESGTSAERTA